MKRWTVMLIPHDRGSSRVLNLSAYQIWFVILLLAALSFTTAFLYERHKTFVREVARLQYLRQELELQCAKYTQYTDQTATTVQERIELEKRIRAEYEASLAAITAELTDIYFLDKQVRELSGLAPRTASRESGPVAAGGGKGGGASGLGDLSYAVGDLVAAPSAVIYGLSHPSADLIIQEINLRSESLRNLVAGLQAKEDQLLRRPSIWPARSWRRMISSSFGYRRDPFTYRVCHHDGLDITAPTGTPAMAAAKGVVVASQYDGPLGNIVKIDHGNGIETWYAHLKTRGVKAGDIVERKTPIGTVGSTGRSTGPHLHYEVHVNGRPVDPAKYVRD